MRLKLNYNSKDISTDIAPYLLSFQFSDKASGEADDIQINLEDRDKLWESEWFPNKGDTIEAFFIIENWESAGKTEVQLGVFEIDEIEITKEEIRNTHTCYEVEKKEDRFIIKEVGI